MRCAPAPLSSGGPVFIASLVANAVALSDSQFSGVLPAVIGLIGLSGTIVAPDRIYRRLGVRA